MRIRWLAQARRNLNDATEYVTRGNVAAAARMYVDIRTQVDRLSQYPALGRSGRIHGTRELVIDNYPYIVPYRVKNDEIHILRVFNTSQDPPLKW